ncbi:MAG TPA: hypothetical protein VMV29_24265 [Ktedonobacterales bacterium]|nr:hypothetical protein [Ktedonobacterales bacterium]
MALNDESRLPYGFPRMPDDAQDVMVVLQRPERYTPTERAEATARAKAIWAEVGPAYAAAWDAFKRDLLAGWEETQRVMTAMCDLCAICSR